jgi:hypothetical protein
VFRITGRDHVALLWLPDILGVAGDEAGFDAVGAGQDQSALQRGEPGMAADAIADAIPGDLSSRDSSLAQVGPRRRFSAAFGVDRRVTGLPLAFRCRVVDDPRIWECPPIGPAVRCRDPPRGFLAPGGRPG